MTSGHVRTPQSARLKQPSTAHQGAHQGNDGLTMVILKPNTRAQTHFGTVCVY
jgi:hypothetical protein